jgi:ribosomal peptide maturation radical SAM protein 1
MSLSIALVAMPWFWAQVPSAELGVLSAHVRRQRPKDTVSAHFAYLDLAASLGLEAYNLLAEQNRMLGEPLYLTFLYPERLLRARMGFIGMAEWIIGRTHEPAVLAAGATGWGAAFDRIQAQLAEHLEALALALAAQASVVELNAAHYDCQLFASLALARRYKQLRPEGTVIIGGVCVSGRVGPSLLSEYEWLDYIVQGEVERPLVALLDALDEHRADAPIKGVLSRRIPSAAAPPPPTVQIRGTRPRRDATGTSASSRDDVGSMEELPYPDFDVYAERARELDIPWSLQIEGSRGCWWDRAKRTGDPRAICLFCSLTAQTNGYHEKSVDRLVDEVTALCRRHERTSVQFWDLIMRNKGIPELATALKATGLELSFYHELRAQISPSELVHLWQAGLTSVQFGIEGLSSSFLERIGKGTSVIQNLQSMKVCEELGIENGANLLIDFPGTTAEEVEQTRNTILHFALPYRPCFLAPFQLSVGSTVDSVPDEFGITNVRNADVYRAGMPLDVWRRLRLFNLDFDATAPKPSWDRVREACEVWRRKYAARSGPMLCYRDGGTFLIIRDARGDSVKETVLRGLERRLYLYCCQIRSTPQLLAAFAEATAEAIHEALDRLVSAELVYKEGSRFLSLAIASSPAAAVARIQGAASQ